MTLDVLPASPSDETVVATPDRLATVQAARPKGFPMLDVLYSAEAPDWDYYRPGFSKMVDSIRHLEADLDPEQIVEEGWQIVEVVHPFTPDASDRTWVSTLVEGRVVWVCAPSQAKPEAAPTEGVQP